MHYLKISYEQLILSFLFFSRLDFFLNTNNVFY